MKEVMLDSFGDCHLVIKYRCVSCGKLVKVPDHLDEHFKASNPACPRCGESVWEPAEEDAE